MAAVPTSRVAHVPRATFATQVTSPAAQSGSNQTWLKGAAPRFRGSVDDPVDEGITDLRFGAWQGRHGVQPNLPIGIFLCWENQKGDHAVQKSATQSNFKVDFGFLHNLGKAQACHRQLAKELNISTQKYNSNGQEKKRCFGCTFWWLTYEVKFG